MTSTSLRRLLSTGVVLESPAGLYFGSGGVLVLAAGCPGEPGTGAGAEEGAGEGAGAGADAEPWPPIVFSSSITSASAAAAAITCVKPFSSVMPLS